jgi:hypothetical protein
MRGILPFAAEQVCGIRPLYDMGLRKLDEHQVTMQRHALHSVASKGTTERFKGARHRLHGKEQIPMAHANPNPTSADDDVPEEPIPAIQQLLDNPFLLLFLGIAMPTVLYIVWGVMEIVGIPVAK